MPRACSLCTHPDRLTIEAALRDGTALRTMAARWSVSKTALLRHRERHVPPPPPVSPEAQALVATYQKVTAILEALAVLTDADWEAWTWQVRHPHAAALRSWALVHRMEVLGSLRAWQAALARQMRALGVQAQRPGTGNERPQ